MKVLLDEDLPHPLRLAIVSHEVQTVVYAGWAGVKNGKLLNAAEQAGFEVFVTGDRQIPSQQNLTGRHIAVVVLSTIDFEVMTPHVDLIQAAIDEALPGSLQEVECGRFSR